MGKITPPPQKKSGEKFRFKVMDVLFWLIL